MKTWTDARGRNMASPDEPGLNGVITETYGEAHRNLSSMHIWQCGCREEHRHSGRNVFISCGKHDTPPPIIRTVELPIEGTDFYLRCSTEHLKKIRRRCEDRLRKSGDGLILKVAHMLAVDLY